MNIFNLQNEEKMNDAKFLLDPLSVIVKLSIFSKKNAGCKISVYNNTLYIQEAGIFQSLVRYVYKNTKIDIQYLYNPIELSCKYFLKNEEYIKNIPNIKKLFINAQNGINVLINLYKEHLIISHILFYYYNIISNYLSDNFNENLFIKDTISDFYTEEILNDFNSIWTVDKIKIVLNMIEFVDNDKDADKSIKCLEEFMVLMDENIINIIKKKYSKDDQTEINNLNKGIQNNINLNNELDNHLNNKLEIKNDSSNINIQKDKNDVLNINLNNKLQKNIKNDSSNINTNDELENNDSNTNIQNDKNDVLNVNLNNKLQKNIKNDSSNINSNDELENNILLSLNKNKNLKFTKKI
jgi:hypothetical protein